MTLRPVAISASAPAWAMPSGVAKKVTSASTSRASFESGATMTRSQ